jgi:hypothetical protein
MSVMFPFLVLSWPVRGATRRANSFEFQKTQLLGGNNYDRFARQPGQSRSAIKIVANPHCGTLH